eukprot:scaffold169360_cov32-Tisochrysis_lutea.AAC.2
MSAATKVSIRSAYPRRITQLGWKGTWQEARGANGGGCSSRSILGSLGSPLPTVGQVPEVGGIHCSPHSVRLADSCYGFIASSWVHSEERLRTCRVQPSRARHPPRHPHKVGANRTSAQT